MHKILASAVLALALLTDPAAVARPAVHHHHHQHPVAVQLTAYIMPQAAPAAASSRTLLPCWDRGTRNLLWCKRLHALHWAEANARGCWYVWGGTGPCQFGYDCSGLVMTSFAHAGFWLPRTTWEMQQSSRLRLVGYRRPGEIILYGWPAYHAAIYAGAGMQFESSHQGERTGLHPVDWEAGPQFYDLR